MLPKYTIARTTIPSQRADQAVINPRENSPTDWQYSLNRDVGHSKGMMGASFQDDNFRSNDEGWQSIKNGMYDRLEGTEPIYGHVNYELNRLDNNSTNRVADAIHDQTRVQWSRNLRSLTQNVPSQYPYYQGRPSYVNYVGSAYYRMGK